MIDKNQAEARKRVVEMLGDQATELLGTFVGRTPALTWEKLEQALLVVATGAIESAEMFGDNR